MYDYFDVIIIYFIQWSRRPKLCEYLLSIDVLDNLSEISVDTTEKGIVLSNMVNMQRMKNNLVRLEKDDISNIFPSPAY